MSAYGKFHINPMSGEVGICRAGTAGGCPFRGTHYETADEARTAFEERMTEDAVIAGVRKSGVNVVSAEKVGEKTAAELDRWDHEYIDAVKYANFREKAGFPQGMQAMLMDKFYGESSYDEVISKAKERSNYVSSYFNKVATKKVASRVLDGNTTVASSAVAERSKAALSAASAAPADSSRVLRHALRPTSVDARNYAAFAAARAAKASSPVGAAARGFTA